MSSGRAPNGILNLKNTCYVNSVLQLLGLCEDVLEKLWAGCGNASEFVKQLGLVIELVNDGTGNVVKPEGFVRSSFETFTNFSPYKQQDSLEYLAYVLNKISEDCPLVGEYFKGKQIQKIECVKCKSVSESEDCFNTLGIPFPRNTQTRCSPIFAHFFSDETSGISLKDLFSQYFLCEKRSFMHCSRCCRDCEQIITEYVQHSGDYLITYLKRYTGSFWNPKISTTVELPQYFPARLLNLDESSNYRLLGLIEHSSYLVTGHYTCYVLKNNSWYYINDTKVKRVEWEKVSKAQAYIMLFKKC